MERTLSKLNRQITQRLKGINEYEAIHINKGLSDVCIILIFQKMLNLPASLLILQ